MINFGHKVNAPKRALRVSERDAEIVRSLVHHVRVFSLQQVARTWWSLSAAAERDAKRRLELLQEDGQLRLYTALAHPEIPIEAPAVAWEPGSDTPDFGALSYRLRSRWKLPPRQTTFAIATRLAGRSVGGPPARPSRESEQTHDLHFAAVFLSYRQRQPELIPHWKSEAAILRDRGHTREKLPDALLELPDGARAVEFGGAYSKTKLEGFHVYCERLSMPYEVW